MPMATKFGRVVACHEDLPTIKSSEPLILGLPRSRKKLSELYLH